MIFSVGYLLARCLLTCLTVLARREASKDAELLVLRRPWTRHAGPSPEHSRADSERVR